MDEKPTYAQIEAAYDAYVEEVERFVGRSTIMARAVRGEVTRAEWIEESHARARAIVGRMEARWAEYMALRSQLSDTNEGMG